MWHKCDISVVFLEIVLENMCLRLSLTSHYSHTCILKAFSRKAITKTMIKYYILYTLYFWILPKLWICMCIKLDVWTYTFFIRRAHDTICSPPFRLGLLEINLQSTPSFSFTFSVSFSSAGPPLPGPSRDWPPEIASHVNDSPSPQSHQWSCPLLPQRLPHMQKNKHISDSQNPQSHQCCCPPAPETALHEKNSHISDSQSPQSHQSSRSPAPPIAPQQEKHTQATAKAPSPTSGPALPPQRFPHMKNTTHQRQPKPPRPPVVPPSCATDWLTRKRPHR